MSAIPARLQYGPFDGATGHVSDQPVPMALDVRKCPGPACGCGSAIHYSRRDVAAVTTPGFVRYELVDLEHDQVLYRHADTHDPAEARFLTEGMVA